MEKSMFFSNALLNPEGGSRRVFRLDVLRTEAMRRSKISPTIEQKLRPPCLTWGGTLVRMFENQL